MRISTRTHAFLDLATAGFALAFPRLLGASNRFTNIMTAVALGKLGYGLLTRHELGVVRVLPMKTHLTLDAIAGAATSALPFVLDEEENPAVTACAVGLGLSDIAAASITETRSKPEIEGALVAPGGTMLRTGLPTASLADTLRVMSYVATPNLAKGPIIRRPAVMAVGEQLDLDTVAVKTLQEMRAKYGSGPLMLRLPFRSQAVILDPEHVRRVLNESPEPFATATSAKYAALAHFEPKLSLVSHGRERAERRQLNEEVLESKSTIHQMAERFLPIIDEEARALLQRVRNFGELRWNEFADAWSCIVRRIVFGDAARDDRRITDLMVELRSDANWLVLKPRRTDLRDELHRRIRQYIEKGEPGSLAAYMAGRTRSSVQAPEQQIPQWLFAFEPAAMATFRALALLAAHPQQLERAREETTGGVAAGRAQRPFLRAAVMEALRLWPTTPMILRQTTRETEWENGTMPAETSILVFAPFFHRDDERDPFAHAFNPDLWIDDDPEVKGFPPREWPFFPFSGGPAHCPGQNIVLLLTSGMLASLIGDRTIRLKDPQRMPPGRLPGTQDHYTLRFEVEQPGRTARATAPGGAAGARAGSSDQQ